MLMRSRSSPLWTTGGRDGPRTDVTVHRRRRWRLPPEPAERGRIGGRPLPVGVGLLEQVVDEGTERIVAALQADAVGLPCRRVPDEPKCASTPVELREQDG